MITSLLWHNPWVIRCFLWLLNCRPWENKTTRENRRKLLWKSWEFRHCFCWTFESSDTPIFLTVSGSPVTMHKYFGKRMVCFVKSLGSISCQITEKSRCDIRNSFLVLNFSLPPNHPHHPHLCLACLTICIGFEVLTIPAAILAMSAGRCNQRNVST